MQQQFVEEALEAVKQRQRRIEEMLYENPEGLPLTPLYRDEEKEIETRKKAERD